LSTFPLLDLPVERAARLVALDLLDEAAAAVPRLADPADAEALHDLRVALRRLRSVLRAYRPHLASIGKKLRRAIRDLAAETGAGRDSEVALEWLNALPGDALTARERAGLRFLVTRLGERRDAAYQELRAAVAEGFGALRARLAPRLERYDAAVRDEEIVRFGAATGELVAAHAAELEEHLDRVRSPEDETEAHEARIAAKRLRYVLEPLRDERPHVAAIIRRMKALQELLGQLHDTAVLSAELPAALEEAAARRARQAYERALKEGRARRAPADPHPGLLAIGRLLRERRDALHGELAAGWLEGRARPFLDDVASLVSELRGAPAGRD
jgi:CHAD domain-containing protein